jgi:diketogulonate reductase-like aldo/keto reductase
MEIPEIGFGTYLVQDPAQTESSIIAAIEAGYRHIDTAAFYQNEEIIGQALQKVFQKGTVKSQDLFITTKLYETNHRPERVEKAFLNSLQNLKLDYLDLYLIHWPHAFVPSDDILIPALKDGKPIFEHIDILDTWKELEKLVEKGLTRKIGVSNFSIEMLERMEFSPQVKIQPYTNQVEHNIYLQQSALIAYLERRKIYLTSYSPLENQRKGPFGVFLIEDPVLIEIAKEIGKNPAHVALKFLLQISPIVRIIPKSVTPIRILENFQLNFELSSSQI